MVSNKFLYSTYFFFFIIHSAGTRLGPNKQNKQNKVYKQKFCLYTLFCLFGPDQLVMTLIASTRVLARRRAKFASIVCLLPSAFLKLVSAISRVC